MIKILLAEDDSSMREYLARALERVGYSVKPWAAAPRPCPCWKASRSTSC
jgi:two-component system cell cycle response regulator CpdR